jgi:hypothetical protein
MSALAQCDAFAFIYDQAGDPAPDVLVVLKRVLDASGNPILLGPKTTLTDSAGSFHFTLPEFATAFISARASALWNCPDGRAFTVPPGPSGELVPDFSLPASTLVEPPLVYVGDVLSIPQASETQDGYLSAADFVRFEAGAAMGVTEINTGAGLTGGPITDAGTIALAPVSGVAGTWSNPTSISINAYGQIIAITATADTTAPVITLIATPTIGSSSVTITWHTDDPSDSQVEYGPTIAYENGTTTIDSTPVTSHSVTITGLSVSTPYHYRVKSRNTAGLLTTSGDNTFTTTIVVDTTPPVITLASTPVTAITDVGATINWTTDEAADSQVDYSTDLSYGTHSPVTNPAPPGVTTHAVTLTGLLALQLYHYRVNSKDASGNAAIPVTGTFTTTAAPPPVNTLLTGLVSMWKMDETGTSAVRVDSHGANDLIATSSVGSGAGKISNAAHFTGTGDRLEVASNTGLQTGPVDYTVAFWVNLDINTAPMTIMNKAGVSGQDEYVVSYKPAPIDRFVLEVYAGGAYANVNADSAGSPTVGQWYLIVAWHNQAATTINIQVNNGVVDSFTPVPPVFSGASDVIVGTYGPGIGAMLSGLVDEAAFWKNHIVSPADRTALYFAGSGLPFSDWT